MTVTITKLDDNAVTSKVYNGEALTATATGKLYGTDGNEWSAATWSGTISTNGVNAGTYSINTDKSFVFVAGTDNSRNHLVKGAVTAASVNTHVFIGVF